MAEADGYAARVTLRRDGRADVHVRKRTFEVGAPLSFDSAYDGVTAVEQLLGALGADLVCGLMARAKKRRVEVDRAEATVEARLNNPLVYLDVVGEEGHTGIEKIVVRVYVSSFAEEEALQALWRETLARSPLVNTVRKAVDLDLSLKIAF
jgi:hypothetical protein